MGRAWRTMAAGVLVLGFIGAAGCGDDEDSEPDPDEVTTDEEYADHVAALCEQHTAQLAREVQPQVDGSASDADIASYWQADYIPRVRAVMRSLLDQGVPVDEEQDILAAFNQVDAVLTSVDNDVYGYIDRTRNGDPGDQGTFDTAQTELDGLLEPVGIDCLTD